MIQPLFQLPKEHINQLDDVWGPIHTSGMMNSLSPESCQKLLLLLGFFYEKNILNNDPVKLFGRIGSWLLTQLQTYCSSQNDEAIGAHLNVYFNISSKLDDECRDTFQNIIGAYCFRTFIYLRNPTKSKTNVPPVALNEVHSAALELLSSPRPTERTQGFLLLCHPDISSVVHLAQLFKTLPILLSNEELTSSRSNLYTKFCLFLKKFSPNLFQTSSLEKFEKILESECNTEEVHQAFCEAFATTEDDTYFQIIFEVWKGMHEGKESTALSLISRYQKAMPANALKILCEQLENGKTLAQVIQSHWLLFLETPDKNHLESLVKIALWLITKNQNDKELLAAHIFKLIGLCCKFNEFNHAHTIYEAAKTKSFFPNLSKHNFAIWRLLCTQYYAKEKMVEAYQLSEKLIENKDPDLVADLLLKIDERHRNDKLINLFLKALTLQMSHKLACELADIILKYISDTKILSPELRQSFILNASKLIETFKSDLNESPPNSKSTEFCKALQLMHTHQIEVCNLIDDLALWPTLQNLHETSAHEFEVLSLSLINAHDKHLKDDQEQKASYYLFLAARNLNNVSILNACLRRAAASYNTGTLPSTDHCALFDSYLATIINEKGLKLAQEMLEIMTKKWGLQMPLWVHEHWRTLAVAAEKQMPVLAAKILMEKGLFVRDVNLPLNVCMNLLTIKIPTADNLAISLAANYNIEATKFWILALPLCSPSIPNAMQQLEKFCLEKSFSGPQEESQACWQTLLNLIKEHKPTLLISLLKKFDLIISTFNEEQKNLKGQFALSFNNGLLTLLLDYHLDELNTQLLRTKIPDIYEISFGALPQEALLEFKLRIIRYRLSTTGDLKVTLAIGMLSEDIVPTSSPHYKQFESLVIQAMDLYISKAIDDAEALNQLHKIIDSLDGAIDPIKILQLYTLKINEEYYKKILEILFPKNNWDIRPLKPAQKKVVTAVIDKVFLWLCNNPMEFKRFLSGIETTTILSKENLSHWFAHDESRKLNIAITTIENENVPIKKKWSLQL